MNSLDLSSLHHQFSEDERILHITMDHGRVNEMGSTELRDWAAITAHLHANDVRAWLSSSTKTTRSGKPIFIAGANVTERSGWDDAAVKTHVRWQRETLAALRRAPAFHVTIVDGLALGWGTEFMITADYRIATPRARFALPETGIGILPGAGGTAELSRIIGPNQALRLGMTGEQISAQEAVRIGLVDEIVATETEAQDRALALAKLAARRSPTATAAFKAGVLASLSMSEAERTELEAQSYELCVDSGDAAIGRANFKAVIAGEPVAWGPRKTQ
jgi:enoyl-CoA hydratase/carnithine racemase